MALKRRRRGATPRKRKEETELKQFSFRWWAESNIRMVGGISAALVATGTLVFGFIGFLRTVGWAPVVNHELVQLENKVIAHADKNTSEVKRTVDEVRKQLDTFASSIASMTINMLEDKRWALINQKTQQAEQIASIKKQREERPTDQFMIRRELEVDNWAKVLDRQIAQTEDRLEKLKRGER